MQTFSDTVTWTTLDRPTEARSWCYREKWTLSANGWIAKAVLQQGSSRAAAWGEQTSSSCVALWAPAVVIVSDMRFWLPLASCTVSAKVCGPCVEAPRGADTHTKPLSLFMSSSHKCTHADEWFSSGRRELRMAALHDGLRGRMFSCCSFRSSQARWPGKPMGQLHTPTTESQRLRSLL